VRTRLVFKVYGSNREDLIRRANQVIEDFLGDLSQSSVSDIEMEVELVPVSDDKNGLFESDSVSNFVATVYVKLKQS
jgi:hypothetical protein